jgi:DNA integrity scanning protein DisA with diadenylate cyclase activity
MEFKGTKGKWYVTQDTHVWVDDSKICDCSNTGQFSFYRKKSDEEMKANALLISKAPEMLDMLEKLKDRLGYFNDNVSVSEIKQLIKEATELK